jgi:diacylglycerol kinase (ATP)
MKATVIINPAAGRGRALRLFPAVEKRLAESGEDFTIQVSQSPQDPPRLVREAIAAGAQMIVAGGGDGTSQMVAGALLGSQAILGILPLGRGNDFARGLGIPKDPLVACGVLTEGTVRKIDIGRIGQDKIYLNMAGAGFDGEAIGRANRLPVKGAFAYFLSVFLTLISFRAVTFTLEHDRGTWKGKAMMLGVANSTTYGGGMRLAPDAKVDDGLFDVVIIKEVGKLEFVRVFPRVYQGTHISHPAVEILRTTRVQMACSAPFDLYADGDRMAPLPVQLELVPRALAVMTPSQKAAIFS